MHVSPYTLVHVDLYADRAGLSLESKFDGWRCQILTGVGRLWSRHGTDLTAPFADVARAARFLPECVLDGELVAVLNSEAPPS
ncbi:hypothetical protein [Streptomyces sp. NPDC001876]|uniref:ATP-dependent DNA ligase n=1 Tax=Streptomyces sp. NPDC001876 TaxID=3154402 RepID=UPI0033230AF3